MTLTGGHAAGTGDHPGDHNLIDAALAMMFAFVNHGSTAATARPANVGKVWWVGSVQPTNANTNDIWLDTTTTPGTMRRFTSSTVTEVITGTSAVSGLNWRGAWASGVSYAVNDAVFGSGASFKALVAHTSGAAATVPSMARQTVTDGVTAVGITVSSASAPFAAATVGDYISGGTIPAGASILTVSSDGTSCTMSAPATAAANGVSIQIAGPGPNWAQVQGTPWNFRGIWMPSTYYAFSDVVLNDGVLWFVNTPLTSGASGGPSRASHGGSWTPVVWGNPLGVDGRPLIQTSDVSGLDAQLASLTQITLMRASAGTHTITTNTVDPQATNSKHPELNNIMAAGTYRVRGLVFLSGSNDTADYRCGLYFPSGTVGPVAVDAPSASASTQAALSGMTSDVGQTAQVFGAHATAFMGTSPASGQVFVGVAAFGPGSSNPNLSTVVTFDGEITVPAGGGTVGIGYSQNVATTGLTLKVGVGSFLELRPIPTATVGS